jgi:DNA-binding protein YbaB
MLELQVTSLTMAARIFEADHFEQCQDLLAAALSDAATVAWASTWKQ